MRRLLRYFALVALFAASLEAALAQGQRPQFRPAVLISGPESLINRIDGRALMSAGQKDGAVMFCAVVAKTGEIKQSRTYRGTPGTAALEQEVRKRLEGAKFTPAIYNHQPVAVVASGTVIFSVVENQPRVRLLLNQDSRELKEASDFIAPQPVFGGDSAFTGFDYPAAITVQVNAVVDLGLKVDARGNPGAILLIAEEPPLLGFAAVAAKDFAGAKFIPAFRNGDATECETVYPVSYQSAEWATPSFAPAPVEPASFDG